MFPNRAPRVKSLQYHGIRETLDHSCDCRAALAGHGTLWQCNAAQQVNRAAVLGLHSVMHAHADRLSGPCSIHMVADEKVCSCEAVGLVGDCRDLIIRDGRFHRSHAFWHASHHRRDRLHDHERDTGSDCRRGRSFLRCRNELADVGSTGPCGRGDSSNQSAANRRRRRYGSSDPWGSACRNGRVFRGSLHLAFSETVRRNKLPGSYAGSLVDCCVGFCCSGYCFRPPTVRFFRRRSDGVVCGSILGRGYSGACSCFMV